MPHRSSDPKQQFVAVEDLLTRWLKERRALLGKYTEIVVTLDSNLNGEQLQRRQTNCASCWWTMFQPDTLKFSTN